MSWFGGFLARLGRLRPRFGHSSFYLGVAERLQYGVERTVFGFLWKLEMVARGVRLRNFWKADIIGRPLVSLGFGSSIVLGRGVILMSSSRFCLSSSLWAPCKLKTISEKAAILLEDGASLNGASIVSRSQTIRVGARTMLGPNVMITDSPFHPLWPIEARSRYAGNEHDKPVIIGDDVWIGARVIVLPGAEIGSGAVVGAGSIVRGVIPPNCLAAGVPARFVRQLDAGTAQDREATLACVGDEKT